MEPSSQTSLATRPEEPAVPPLLLAALQEALVLCTLAVLGLVLRVALALVDPEVFGEARATVYGVAGVASWILMGSWATGRATVHAMTVRTARRAASEADEVKEPVVAAEEAEALPEGVTERGRAARARRQAGGMPESVLTREDLFERLATELDVALREEEWMALVLVKLDVLPADPDSDEQPVDGATRVAATARTVVEHVRSDDFVGHVGDGLFVVGLPRTNVREAREPEARLRAAMGEVAEELECRLLTSFVTSHVDDSLDALYSRALLAMTPARVPERARVLGRTA